MLTNTRKAKQLLEAAKRTWKILRGDKVVINAGKDKGQMGTVKRVLRRKNKVIVEGLNLAKKHMRKQGDQPGRIVTIEVPIDASNVSIADPVSQAPVRVSWRFLEDGTKVRVTKGKLASGTIVPRPEILKVRRTPRKDGVGPKDTPPDVVKQVTYQPNTQEVIDYS